MSLWLLGALAVLVAWGGLRLAREQKDTEAQGHGGTEAQDAEIDRAALEAAEREVQGLDSDGAGRPLEDTPGDDWGPGTARPPHML